MNHLQVYHPSPRDDGVDRDVFIPESVLRAREHGKIVPVDKKRGPKKLRAGYAPTKDDFKDDFKDDNNNDNDDNKAMDNTYTDSKDICRTSQDMVWETGGTGVWAPDYR